MSGLADFIRARAEEKRRVATFGLAHAFQAEDEHWATLRLIEHAGSAVIDVTILRLLAHPYRHHPEFDQKWSV